MLYVDSWIMSASICIEFERRLDVLSYIPVFPLVAQVRYIVS